MLGCSTQNKTPCNYKDEVNLYLYPFHYLVPFPMKIDGVISNSSTQKVTLKNSDLPNKICKQIKRLDLIEKIKTFDSRLVVELNNNSSVNIYIAVRSTKEMIFFADNFYKCDEECQKEIIEPLLSFFKDE